MRAALALFAAALLPSVAFCADAKPKSRTLAELTKFTVENGEANDIEANISNSLGLGKKPVPAVEIYYDKSVAPDGFEHVFNVLTKNAKRQGIVINLTKIDEKDGVKTVKGFSYYLTLEGKLKQAFETNGLYGQVEHTILPVDAKTKSMLKKELSFWTESSVNLKWEK